MDNQTPNRKPPSSTKAILGYAAGVAASGADIAAALYLRENIPTWQFAGIMAAALVLSVYLGARLTYRYWGPEAPPTLRGAEYIAGQARRIRTHFGGLHSTSGYEDDLIVIGGSVPAGGLTIHMKSGSQTVLVFAWQDDPPQLLHHLRGPWLYRLHDLDNPRPG